MCNKTNKLKTCNKCQDELVIGVNFAESRAKRYEYICHSCKNKQRAERRNNFKLKAIEYMGGKCADCGGVFHHKVFDFHHLDPSEKDGRLTERLRCQSWNKLKEELDKCVLLCANCHRIRHIEDNSIGL
jgi:hypothetical protein